MAEARSDQVDEPPSEQNSHLADSAVEETKTPQIYEQKIEMLFILFSENMKKQLATLLERIRSTRQVEIIQEPAQILFRGQNRDEVDSAKIDFIKSDQSKYGAKFRNQGHFTHFISVPFKMHPDIVALQQNLQDPNNVQIQGVLPRMHMPPEKHHLTLGQLALSNEDRFEEAKRVYNGLVPQIQEILEGGPVVTFDKLGFFGDEAKARVLYLEPVKDDPAITRIHTVANLLVREFLHAGVVTQSELKKQHLEYKNDNLLLNYHLSMIRSAKGGHGKKQIPFDVRQVNKGPYEIQAQVTEVHLSWLRGVDETGYYLPEIIATIS